MSLLIDDGPLVGVKTVAMLEYQLPSRKMLETRLSTSDCCKTCVPATLTMQYVMYGLR